MGVVYCGPYAELVGSEEHEGYAARVLPDGSLTGSWTLETREFSGYVAACACGWRGAVEHAPVAAGERAATEEWDRDHVQALIEAARRGWPAWADGVAASVQIIAREVSAGRFRSASLFAEDLAADVKARARLIRDLAENADGDRR